MMLRAEELSKPPQVNELEIARKIELAEWNKYDATKKIIKEFEDRRERVLSTIQTVGSSVEELKLRALCEEAYTLSNVLTAIKETGTYARH